MKIGIMDCFPSSNYAVPMLCLTAAASHGVLSQPAKHAASMFSITTDCESLETKDEFHPIWP